MYWWCRFDGQTEIPNNSEIFNTNEVMSWLKHESVLQGGELTAWTKLLKNDDQMLTWMQKAKSLNKKIEGHFPGASESTLAKLMLLGADCDHEAMNGQEAISRLMQGYTVSLRHSSIRPDLNVLLKELIELGIKKYDRFFFTTDGSHPFFFETGMTDELIRIAINQGIPLTEAYGLASYNFARYYGMEHLHGSVATGRIANINILNSKENPTPISVIANGKWVKKENTLINHSFEISWDKILPPLNLNWSLNEEDFIFSSSNGIDLLNNVITKPYQSHVEIGSDLSYDHDECYLMMVDRNGLWRVNTLVKGFATCIGGFASPYSGTGDILILGKNISDMLTAYERMKKINGGIVLAEDNQIVHEIRLSISGIMSSLNMEELIREEKLMIDLLQERGYKYNDPAFTLLFFSATHLPYIRLTPRGLYDVKNNEVIKSPEKRNV